MKKEHKTYSQDAKAPFVNNITGEAYEREQYRDYIYLADPELRQLCKLADRYEYDLNMILDDVNDYIQMNWDSIPVSYFYVRSWIMRNANMNSNLYKKTNGWL